MTIAKTAIAAIVAMTAATSSFADEHKEEFIDHLAHLPEAFSGDASVAVVTDYRFRGISRTSRDPAVQGSLSVSHDSGIYVGAWGSSVDTGLNTSGVEMDYTIGYAGEKALSNGKTVDYDVHYVYYDYPGSDAGDIDFQEVGFSLGMGYTMFDMYESHASIGYDYSDDFANSLGDSHYTQLNYTIGNLPGKLELGLHIGYSDFDKDAYNDEDSYTDYKVSLSRPIYDFDVEVAYIDTDLSNSDVGGNIANDTVMLTLSKDFSF